jgi:hypothetical protein
MATITADEYLDSGTARTAGEDWTCNGGRLTVRTDTRWHADAPASMTGTLGSVSISATLGGGYTIDGRNVRWMAYDAGAGNVPAIGSTITGGTSGATGYILGIWASITAAPTAVGAAAGATGFIKFREVTGAFEDNEALTSSDGSGFTGNANGVDVVGWIEVVHDQSEAITVPRLGDMTVRGDWFDLGTTSGSANQLVQLPTNGSSTTYGLGLWIANTASPTTDDDYDFYPAIYIAGMNTTNFDTDERCKFVCMETDGQLRIGHNGTGAVCYVPPAGRAIRVPNIFLRQATTAARDTNAIPHATLGTRPDFSTTAGGNLDWDHCSCDWYVLFSQPYAVRLENCAFERTLSISECATDLDIYDVGIATSTTVDTNALVLTSNFAGGVIEKGSFHRYSTGSSDHAVSVQFCINLSFIDCQAGIMTYARTTSGVAFYLSQSADCDITRLTNFNGQLTVNSCSEVTVTDLDHCDRYLGETNSTSGIYAILFQNCTDCIADGVTWGLNDTQPNCHPYLGVFNENAGTRNIFRNVGTRAAIADGGSAHSPSYIYVSAGNCVDTKVQRCYVQPTRTGAIATQNNDTRQTFEHVYGDFSDTMTVQALNSIVRNCGGTNTVSAVSSVYGTHFWDAFTSDTEGRVILSMNEPTEDTDGFVTVVAGTPRFTSAGGLTMPTLNDEIIIEQSYFVKGCTGLPNTAPVVTGTNVTYVSGPDWGNHDIYFQIDVNDGSGWNGSWLDLTGANLNSFTGDIDPDLGFKLKYRIVCDTAATNNLISYIRISTDSTLTAQTNNLYPLDTVPITVTVLDVLTGDPIQNARVFIEADSGGPASAGEDILTGLTNASGVITGTTEYVSQPVVGKVRRASAGYGTLYKTSPISATIDTDGLALTILMIPDE